MAMTYKRVKQERLAANGSSAAKASQVPKVQSTALSNGRTTATPAKGNTANVTVAPALPAVIAGTKKRYDGSGIDLAAKNQTRMKGQAFVDEMKAKMANKPDGVSVREHLLKPIPSKT